MKRELETDAYIDKADQILQKQKQHIGKLKWEREEVHEEIQKIRQEVMEEKIKIRVALDRQPKINKNIEKQLQYKE